MRIYILALSLFVSTLAIAQPPVDKPADKPEETKEKKDDKPKEKKDKKPRTFRLIGVETSVGSQYYKPFEITGAPTTTSSMYRKFIPDESPFFTYFGDDTYTNYGYGALYNDASYNTRRWENMATSTDFTTTWGFGKKGDVNQKHVIKLGAGYSNRDYRTVSYSYEQYSNRDTLGYTYIGADTSITIKDTSAYVTINMANYASMGHILLGYNYRIHPEEKLSLSFGGGIDIALGTYSMFGSIYQHNDSYVRTQPLGGGIGWNYYDYQNSIRKTSEIEVISERKFKVATFRPYITARVDYRLSKNIPVLKGINVFVEGRYGMEYSNINKMMYSRAPSYLSLKFGVAINFRKGL